MAALLLPHYIRVFNWIVQRLGDVINYPEDFLLAEELRELHRAYLNGAKTEQIAERYPNIHPELIHLLFEKMALQDACWNPMDRLFLTLI